MQRLAQCAPEGSGYEKENYVCCSGAGGDWTLGADVRCRQGINGHAGNQRHDLRLLCNHGAVCTGERKGSEGGKRFLGGEGSGGEIRSRRSQARRSDQGGEERARDELLRREGQKEVMRMASSEP